MFHHAEIFRIENKSSSLIFKYRHVFSRAFLLHNRIFPSAGMGTGSLIGISSCHEVTEKASSGIGNTHCSVDKRLNFHIIRNMCTDFPDFLQRKFSCTYHTLGTKIIPETVCLIVGVVRLCADVALDLRTDLLCVHKDSRICDNQCIRSDLLQFLKIFSYAFKIPVMRQDIHCHINFYTMCMGKGNTLTHVLF